MATPEECKTLYLSLIDCHKQSIDSRINASVYVREFDETSVCDNFFDFTKDRLNLKNKINKSDKTLYDRILHFEETTKDEKKIKEACFHYNKWHEIQLNRALSYRHWLCFNLFKGSLQSPSGK